MALYEFDGEAYKKASVHQKEWGMRVIDDLPLSGNERVLDLGCGDGELTEKLALRVPRGRVVGIDSSWNMIQTARQLERDNLVFRLMDIEYINFEYQFDLIFSNATLQWVKDHRKLLQKVHLRIKPGGRLRLNFAAEGNCENLVSTVRQVMNEGRFVGYFVGFDWPWYFPGLDEYRELLKEFEFSQVRVWYENDDRFFPSAEELIRWIDQPCLIPFLAALPDSEKEAFRDAVVEKMVARTQQRDGRCFETFRRINVLAKK